MTNWRLWVGLTLTTLLIIIALIGPFLAPYSEDYTKKTDYIIEGDTFEVISNPYPPSSEHPFGTTEWGYDVLTLLLYGAKYTIFVSIIVSLLRIFVGGSIGIFSGMNKTNSKKSVGFGLLGSIPHFLILYFILIGITINTNINEFTMVLFQVILMALIGIPGVFSAIQSKTIEVKKNSFIMASRSLGGGKWWISFKHIFPHLKGTFVSMFIKEIILTLTLLGQLGIFKLFLGGTILRLQGPPVWLSKTNEWSGLIGLWRSYIYHYEWVLFFPLACFIFTLFSFYILSRGIEIFQRDQLKRYPHIQ